jgi:tripartite-type tricarboxylate transporter receptor subunit TctC
MGKFIKSVVMVLASAISLGATSVAAKYPDRAVTIIVPYSAGGVTDAYARSIGLKLSELWGQPVIVDNRPGGGTIIGTTLATRAPADGYTILLTSYGFTSNQVLKSKLPYDPSSLTPLLLIGNSSNMFVIDANQPFNNLQEIITWAKANPGALTLASSGNGSSPHIAAELFATEAGVKITHIPYKGTAPAMTDVMGGRVIGIFDGPSAMSRVKAGQLRAIAIASDGRHPNAEGVLSFKEQSVDLVFGSYFGFLVPKGTPESTQKFIFDSIETAMKDPRVADVIATTGILLRNGTQQDFKDFLDMELARLSKLVKMEGVSIVVD